MAGAGARGRKPLRWAGIRVSLIRSYADDPAATPPGPVDALGPGRLVYRPPMIRSMTGFGSATRETDGTSVTVDARSVNSRHLRLRISVPPGAETWEEWVRERVEERLERGQVDVRVEVEARAAAPSLELDRERVEAYLRAFGTLREDYDLAGPVDLSLLARSGGLLRERRIDVHDRVGEHVVAEATRRALDALLEMREREGERLEEDLRGRIEAIESGLERVEERVPHRLERERGRLRDAVDELVAEHDLDDDRLAREIALLADKWDVSEEVVRARSHLDTFRELLDADGEEAVGKRLKFLVQELHREINTTGAKANDAEISREVVEMKNEIERLREQIENVE